MVVGRPYTDVVYRERYVTNNTWTTHAQRTEEKEQTKIPSLSKCMCSVFVFVFAFSSLPTIIVALQKSVIKRKNRLTF